MRRKIMGILAVVTAALALAAPALGDGGWGAGSDSGQEHGAPSPHTP